MFATLSGLDIGAVGFFSTCWVGYAIAADVTPLRRRTVAYIMDQFRVRWMTAMMQRELRIIDTRIVGTVLHGVAFFASTAMLLVGGLIAALGASEEAMVVLSDLPFAAETSRTGWEIKVPLLAAISVYAFFKLAWTFRLVVNCSVLIGAAPLPPVSPQRIEHYATHTGYALSLASGHCNAGVVSDIGRR
ncbi:MAG: DUF599 domain-containing protein [Chromatiales bacterium]|jgi:uncharacterized membrane protein|nr:DUF599 domain-containing protein [Chromatiales bacterium]